jgi:hypothetical protein
MSRPRHRNGAVRITSTAMTPGSAAHSSPVPPQDTPGRGG